MAGFWYGNDASKKPGQYISFFPNADSNTGLAATKKIELDFKAVAWLDVSGYLPKSADSQPDRAK